MSEQKPTAGPWTVCTGAGRGRCTCGHVWGADGNGHVATAHYAPNAAADDLEAQELWTQSLDEMLANAMLIAEAGTVYSETGLSPRQLAEHLKAILAANEQFRNSMSNVSDWSGDPLDDACRAAEAAISRTEPRPSPADTKEKV